MLRLTDDSNEKRRTRPLFRNVAPHIGLVIVVSVYLILGAWIFYLLERPHDQGARIKAKIQLTRDIRSLMNYAFHQKCNRLQYTNTGIPHFWIDQEIDQETYRLEMQTRLFELLKNWDEAIRSYDVRPAHFFHNHFTATDAWLLENNSTRVKIDTAESRWTFSASVLFAFTVITTIGYGNLTPSTFGGRVFCMIYGMMGIPLTMVAVANIGKFLSEGAQMLVNKIRRERAYRKKKAEMVLKARLQRRKSRIVGQFLKEALRRDDIRLDPLSDWIGHTTLLLCFGVYIVAGALCLPLWEELGFLDGCYFSFVTITTVGFGDIVPRRYDYLFPTLVYITVGLAITTLTIEIFGKMLRKIHYLGSKIKNAKSALIWFGNKVLSVQELVTAVGRQYGIPQGEIESLNENLDQVIKDTVESKEAEKRMEKYSAKRKKTSARSTEGSKLAPLFSDYEFRYIDEDSLAPTPIYKQTHVLWKQSI